MVQKESQLIHQALFHASLMYIHVHVAVNISLGYVDNATTYKPPCIYLIGILTKKKNRVYMYTETTHIYIIYTCSLSEVATSNINMEVNF